MSKIVILTNSITGLRSFRLEVMKKFRDDGHDVTIYCPEHEETEEFTDIGCEVKFVKNIQRRGTSIKTDIKLFFEYMKILGKEKPDIFLMALDHLGTDINETYVFEDSLLALETSKKAGFKTVGIYDKNNPYTEEQLAQFSDILIGENQTLESLIEK